MARGILFMILGCFVVLSVTAQQERKFIREGNDLFQKQDFEKAEVEYRKAADKKSDSFEAAFNMADALYKQKKYDEALQQFTELAKQETDKERLGEIYHNIGNTLLSLEKTEESIEAYKKSLRNRPTSEATKYNLEFARYKQQQDQNKDQNQDQNQDQQNQDQNKDQQQQDQNKDQNKEGQDQDKNQQDQKQDQKQDQNKDQQQDQQNGQDKNDKQQQQQPQEGKISKEDAERLLEALQNDEKEVQEKVQKQKAQEQKARRMKIEKNW